MHLIFILSITLTFIDLDLNNFKNFHSDPQHLRETKFIEKKI